MMSDLLLACPSGNAQKPHPHNRVYTHRLGSGACDVVDAARCCSRGSCIEHVAHGTGVHWPRVPIAETYQRIVAQIAPSEAPHELVHLTIPYTRDHVYVHPVIHTVGDTAYLET